MHNRTLNAGEPICILLADDDDDDIFLFQQVILENDSRVHLIVARDGVQAVSQIESVEEQTPDLIFLDINMPRMDGFQCLERILLLPNISQTKIIYLSTSGNKDLINRASKLGAHGYIVKPTSYNQFKFIIGEVLTKDWKSPANMDFWVYAEK